MNKEQLRKELEDCWDAAVEYYDYVKSKPIGYRDGKFPDRKEYLTTRLAALADGEGEKDELIKMQDAYIQFLDKETIPFIQFAAIHGMEVSKEVAEMGKSHRTIISLLKSKLQKSLPSAVTGGVKWVKASERLPENLVAYRPIRIVHSGLQFYGLGNLQSFHNGPTYYDIVSDNHYSFDNVEWLDESPLLVL